MTFRCFATSAAGAGASVLDEATPGMPVVAGVSEAFESSGSESAKKPIFHSTYIFGITLLLEGCHCY